MILLVAICYIVLACTTWPEASEDARLIFLGLTGILCELEARRAKPKDKQ